MRSGLVALIAAFAAACAPRPNAPLWAFPPTQAATPTDTDKTQTLPGSAERFSLVQLADRTTAVDWFPDQHPTMPPAVKGGRGPVFACGYCHLPQGSGRTENADLAGMPYEYLKQQMTDMRSGARKLVDPHFSPDEHMLTTIKQVSWPEAEQAARYFSDLTYVKRLQVVETSQIPHPTANGYVYVFDKAGAREPLGERIMEGPDDFVRFEKRDYRTTFTAYVPIGAIGRGAALAGGANPAKQVCATCHGAGLKGGPLGPPIAGRYPTGLFRQLYAFQTGTRNGPGAALMKPIVSSLSREDMIDLAAYLGSLAP